MTTLSRILDAQRYATTPGGNLDPRQFAEYLGLPIEPEHVDPPEPGSLWLHKTMDVIGHTDERGRLWRLMPDGTIVLVHDFDRAEWHRAAVIPLPPEETAPALAESDGCPV
jgi:hypothetical protein